MKTARLFLSLSAASLVVLAVADLLLGPKAEFVNAFSTLQRLAGQAPSAGDSVVARKAGASGEFAVVFVVSLAIGGILTAVVRRVAST